jgi:hypothetical protein
MSRCRTGWRIYFDRECPPWANPWIATHPRGLSHYRASFDAAKIAVVKETLRDWERVDGVWVERKAATV